MRVSKDIIRRVMRHPIYRLLKNLKEVWIVVIFWFMIAKFPFREPTLELKYHLYSLYPPIASNNLIKEEFNEIKADNPLSSLINSRNLLRIKIINNSSDTIRNVDLQIEALNIADIAIHSNSSIIMSERTTLASFEISDNFIVRFPNFTSIPPRAEVEMLIWGDINIYTFADLIKIFSSADTVHVVEEGSLSGIRFFIGRHLSVLTIFFIIAFLLLGLKRYNRDQIE